MKDKNLTPVEDSPVLDDKELELAKADAENAEGVFTHTFKRPLSYNGKEYKSLVFDFDGLTGADTLQIERELTRKGVNVIVPEFNAEYLAHMASKACTDEIGVDAFEHMSLRDFNTIRSAARRFLLNVGQE
jgi:hypothetical protein